MATKDREIRLGSLTKEDVIFCPNCAILILKNIRQPERWPPIIGVRGLFCPVCQKLLVNLEQGNA